MRLDDKTEVVFPKDKGDIGHTDFWERTVSHLVAKHYKIPQKRLANLPYCQRRARVVGDKVYFGEKTEDGLLQMIRDAVQNNNLIIVHDDHEKRLREDVLEFRRLVRRYRPKSTMTR